MFAFRLLCGAVGFGCFTGSVASAVEAQTASEAVRNALSQSFGYGLALGAVLLLVALSGRGAATATPNRYCETLDGERNRNRSRNRF